MRAIAAEPPVQGANVRRDLVTIGIPTRSQRRIEMVAGHCQLFASILRVALPCASLALATSAAADPELVMEAPGQDHFMEAALHPQAEDTLADEVLVHLTPLDEITADTDFRQYMQNGVPADLRREALRKAWLMRPKIRDYMDPARDYAAD
jgi:hypothetical protein